MVFLDTQVDPRNGSFELTLASAPPNGAIVVHRYINNVWTEWYYFAQNCDVLGLFNNGVPTTPDDIKCTRYFFLFLFLS